MKETPRLFIPPIRSTTFAGRKAHPGLTIDNDNRLALVFECFAYGGDQINHGGVPSAIALRSAKTASANAAATTGDV